MIVTLHEEGHIDPIEQGFIGNRLQGTDVSEFIQAHYGSFVKFLQDGTRHDDKGQGVPFSPDFRAMLPRYRDPTTGVSLGVRISYLTTC